MRRKPKLSLSSAPFYVSILVIIALGAFVGLFWSLHEYQAYQASIDNIRGNYQSLYQQRVRGEVSRLVDFIEFERMQAYAETEDEIRQKVQTAHTIASHMYRFYGDELTSETLRAMVAEILRPIRWQNGKGYYFAGLVSDARLELFADDPYFEGKELSTHTDQRGKPFFAGIIELVVEKGAGVIHFDLEKPAFPGRYFSSYGFVKYFAPFDWFIGAGLDIEDTQTLLREEVLSRMRDLRDGGVEVFAFRDDGTIISYDDEIMVGRSIREVFDDAGAASGALMLAAATGPEKEGFLGYRGTGRDSSESGRRLAFVKTYDEWGWVIGAAIGMDAMERAIAAETATYRQISFRNVAAFVVLFIIAVGLLLYSSYVYSRKIKAGLILFTDFFRAAADSNIKIDRQALVFAEFEELGVLANQMVEDRVTKERRLMRNELRLDTLLRLGAMDKRSLQDIYDFIVQRAVLISGSRRGYLAMVNSNQRYLSLCGYVDEQRADSHSRLPHNITRAVDEGGLPALAVQRGRPLICNDCTTPAHQTFPYQRTGDYHCDVPLLDGGRVVLVVGVAGGGEAYQEADVRQLTLLVEGMWLHVQRMCAEEEMARLERKIIAVSEEERNTIGRDLHDDLGSHLSGVALLSKALHKKLEIESPERAAQLGAIRTLIQEAIEKTRRLARGLYPVHVVEQGLAAALEELAHEAEQLFVVRCTLEIADICQGLDPHIAAQIYFIAREAVFNAGRHGAPKRIEIILTCTEEGGSVQVIDDGCGFDEKDGKKGLGLHSMHYRARAIGARLNIVSPRHGGVSVHMSWER